MNYNHEWQEKKQPLKPLRPVVMPEEDESLWSLQDEYLAKRGLDMDDAVANQWYPTDDNGTPRLVIPASTMVNTWPYYQARAMSDSPVRYKSPSAPRGDALIVVHPEGAPKGSVVVEGPMDALAAAGEGFVGIALMGNRPPEAVLDHLEYLLKTFQPCTILPDRDAFEEGAALTAKLWSRGVKCHLKQITGAKDLAELSTKDRGLLLQP